MSGWRYLNPLYLLDFVDSTGRPDHQKIVAAAVVAGVFWCQLAGKPLDATNTIALGAIGFGPRVFGMFLRTGKWSATTSTSMQVDAARVVEAVIARRKDAEIEPAP